MSRPSQGNKEATPYGEHLFQDGPDQVHFRETNSKRACIALDHDVFRVRTKVYPFEGYKRENCS